MKIIPIVQPVSNPAIFELLRGFLEIALHSEISEIEIIAVVDGEKRSLKYSSQ